MTQNEFRFFLPDFQNAFRLWERHGWMIDVLRENGNIKGFTLTKGDVKITHSTEEETYRPITGSPIRLRVNGRLEEVTPIRRNDLSVAGKTPKEVIELINGWIAEAEGRT